MRTVAEIDSDLAALVEIRRALTWVQSTGPLDRLLDERLDVDRAGTDAVL